MSYAFTGSLVAMVTPFRNGKIDEAKIRELVEFHVANGTDALVPCGTTGESPTLSHDEHKHVVELVVETAAGRARTRRPRPSTSRGTPSAPARAARWS